MVDDVGDDLEDGGDDFRAAGAADDEVWFTIFENDGRGHAAQGTLAGLDGIGLAAHQAEGVWHAGLGAEIVHFVVEQDPGPGENHLGPEVEIDGLCQGDDIAFSVDH